MNTFTAIDVDYSLTKMRCATLTASTATNTGENPSTANANNAQTLSGSFTTKRMGEGGDKPLTLRRYTIGTP